LEQEYEIVATERDEEEKEAGWLLRELMNVL